MKCYNRVLSLLLDVSQKEVLHLNLSYIMSYINSYMCKRAYMNNDTDYAQ